MLPERVGELIDQGADPVAMVLQLCQALDDAMARKPSPRAVPLVDRLRGDLNACDHLEAAVIARDLHGGLVAVRAVRKRIQRRLVQAAIGLAITN